MEIALAALLLTDVINNGTCVVCASVLCLYVCRCVFPCARRKVHNKQLNVALPRLCMYILHLQNESIIGNIICGAAHIKAMEYKAKANGEWRRGHITALECRRNEAELPDDSPFPISASVLRFGAHKTVTCVILINIMY